MTTYHSDPVHKPSHYARWPIEPINFLMRNGVEYWRGAIVKYAMRAGYIIPPGQEKTEAEIEDLQKCIRYCEMRINQLKGEVEL